VQGRVCYAKLHQLFKSSFQLVWTDVPHPGSYLSRTGLPINSQLTLVHESCAGMYGHIAAMACAVKKGVDSVEGVEGVLYQVSPCSTEMARGWFQTPLE